MHQLLSHAGLTRIVAVIGRVEEQVGYIEEKSKQNAAPTQNNAGTGFSQ
jgi:hypothetical protein